MKTGTLESSTSADAYKDGDEKEKTLRKMLLYMLLSGMRFASVFVFDSSSSTGFWMFCGCDTSLPVVKPFEEEKNGKIVRDKLSVFGHYKRNYSLIPFNSLHTR